MPINKKIALLALSLLISNIAHAAEAAPVLVCYTAGPIDTNAAEEAMSSIMKVVQRLGALPDGSFSTTFVANMAECYKVLAEKKAHYIFPSSELYLAKQAEYGLEPLVKPFITNVPFDNYYMIIKKGTFKSLEELQGKKVGGAVLEEPTFLKKVVFQNKIDPVTYFSLVKTPRPVKALRDLTKGKLDGVLVNVQQYNAMKSLPFFEELAVVYTSPNIMQFGLVASKYADKAVNGKVRTALEKLCSDADGKDLCKIFGVDKFVATTREEYSALEQAYAVK